MLAHARGHQLAARGDALPRRRQLQPVLAARHRRRAAALRPRGRRRARRASIRIDPVANRTYHYWHVFVPGVEPGQLYGYRVDGPFDPAQRAALRSRQGPARSLRPRRRRARRATAARPRSEPGDNAATAMKSVVVDPAAYDWEGDAPLRRPSARTIIYEMHVRGFTRHPSSGVAREDARHLRRADREDPVPAGARHHRGRAAAGVPVRRPGLPAGQGQLLGLCSRSRSSRRTRPTARARTRSARSTSSATWSRRCTAPASRSSSTSCSTTPPKATTTGRRSASAGSTTRPTTSSKPDGSRYADYTGCGNTLNANHPIVRRMIVDSLRYWVEEMHVDGFRFDLASILARDASGQPLPNPPVLWDIESDPALAGTKLIAEAWDAAGLYQVGSFVGDAGRSGTAGSATTSATSSAASRASVRRVGRPAARQPRDLRPQGARGRAERQLRHLPRRLHAQRPRLLQPTSTTRRTARTTATAPTTTAAGTAASRGRPTTRPIEALRNRQVKNFLTRHAAVARACR